MERAEQARDSGALAQFAEQRAGSVCVGLVGVGGIGPDGVVDNLRRFLQIHMQGGFAYVQTVLQAVVTRLADCSRLGALNTMFRQGADGSRTASFGVRREKLGFELFQESLPLLLNNGIV